MRLFDLDEAIKLLRGKCVAKYPTTFLVGLFAAADELSKLPEVDAKPVVHGQWEIDQRWCYECSVCKKGYVGMPKTNYCPNCGAKMDGERRNDDA